jgi:hypothetical protein
MCGSRSDIVTIFGSIATMRHELASNPCVAPFAARKVHPTFNVNSRRWRRVALALALGGVLAGCGVPPQFTVNVSYPEGGKPRNDYFDRLFTGVNPGRENSMAASMRDYIVSRGDNQTDKLLQIITEAGGKCSQSGVFYNCEINRNYVSNSCGRGICSKLARNWNLKIRWNSSVPRFTPELNAKIAILSVIEP